MLGFNQDEYLTSAREIIAARKQAETVADDIYDSGCSALFFASVGGSLAPMMAINEFAKELTSVPVYLEQAAELIHRGHKKLNKDAVVVTLSKSGDTKESVAIAEWCKGTGDPRGSYYSSRRLAIGCRRQLAYSDVPQKMAWNMNICCCTGYSSASFFVTASLLIMRDLPASSSYCRKISCRRNASSIPERIALPRQYHDCDYMMWIGGAEMWGEGLSVLNVYSRRDAVEADEVGELR
ncbi:glucosamine--fructose-6-phosphate aminotransferase [Klebsiella pneumoniae]|nr:glucosamine--fructose-6-phosphate aminotransferase [Klebsiella pneumoniae]